MKSKTRERYSYLIILFIIAAVLFCQNYLYQRYQSYDKKSDVVDDTRESGEYAYNHVRVLASPEYEGRAPGTKGNQLAAQYIAGKFQSIGLKPAGDRERTFKQ